MLKADSAAQVQQWLKDKGWTDALAKTEAHTKLTFVESKLPRGSMLMEVRVPSSASVMCAVRVQQVMRFEVYVQSLWNTLCSTAAEAELPRRLFVDAVYGDGAAIRG